jgi:ubiquinone/menaquinone biosynthesis C-methylase UbiE
MTDDAEMLEKIRRQFDRGPYPRKPLDVSPKKKYDVLFNHNLITAYYLRNHKLIETQGKVILDAGCGSGYKALALAEANPGAKIVGIDISEESVKLAKERLHFHGFKDFEGYVLAIEDLPQLGLQFDYINMDEVLYLLTEPVAGLQAMKAVLKSEGIIRTNFHSYYQRLNFYQAQNVFKIMGLMDDTPGEMEIEIVRETIASLKDNVLLKSRTWLGNTQEKNDEWLLCNYLLQGDKGFTIPEMFAALETASLEFISMVNWRQWELLNLFKEPTDLPAFLAMSLPEISLQERLNLFELLNPTHRLLDFWCGHPGEASGGMPVSEWHPKDWEKVTVNLHPQFRNEDAKQDLITSIEASRAFEISRYIPNVSLTPLMVESSMAATLLPLWESGMSVSQLVERHLKIRPVDSVTLEPVSYEQAWEQVTGLLMELETFLYVLLERS